MTLDEIRKLCDAATPGPWNLITALDRQIAEDNCDPWYTIQAQSGTEIVRHQCYYPSAPDRIEDAAFIAAARSLLLPLAEENERLKIQNTKLLAVVETAGDAIRAAHQHGTTIYSSGVLLACDTERLASALARLEDYR